MAGMFAAVMGLIVGDSSAAKPTAKKGATRRELIRLESTIGRDLFGPVPDGHRREFFNLDDNTWVWHEEWDDENGKRQALTTRYDVRPTGVVKSQGGSSYQALTEAEARNLYSAIHVYEQRVGAELCRLAEIA